MSVNVIKQFQPVVLVHRLRQMNLAVAFLPSGRTACRAVLAAPGGDRWAVLHRKLAERPCRLAYCLNVAPRMRQMSRSAQPADYRTLSWVAGLLVEDGDDAAARSAALGDCQYRNGIVGGAGASEVSRSVPDERPMSQASTEGAEPPTSCAPAGCPIS
jgi:hypothetical protein